MTTEFAAKLYEAQHLIEMAGKGYAVFNPKGKAAGELPIIYGFNNGGSPGWYTAVVVAEDGTFLGSHICSSEGYMLHDLGILEGTRPDRHSEDYQPHYPDGYRMDFVAFKHEGLQKALELNKLKGEAAEKAKIAAVTDEAELVELLNDPRETEE